MESDSKEFEARKWTAFETKFPSWKKKKSFKLPYGCSVSFLEAKRNQKNMGYKENFQKTHIWSRYLE